MLAYHATSSPASPMPSLSANMVGLDGGGSSLVPLMRPCAPASSPVAQAFMTHMLEVAVTLREVQRAIAKAKQVCFSNAVISAFRGWLASVSLMS